MADSSGKLAGMGATLAVGSAVVGVAVPVTAPAAAVGVASGLAAAAVGGVGSVVGGAAMWVGGIMAGNSNTAGYGFLTATVNAVLAEADAPPLPSSAPDPAQMVTSAAGLSPPSEGGSTCP
jgi:hypothetical protein